MSGKKHDQGKPDLSLLSSKALLEVAKVMSFGKEKYGAQNWRQGLAWSRVYAAVQRHLLAWNDGETYDPETGISHLAHASCGLMFLLEFAKTRPDLDDRYLNDQGKAVLREEPKFKSQEEIDDLVTTFTKVSPISTEPSNSAPLGSTMPRLRVDKSKLE